MNMEDKIELNIVTVVHRAIAESDNLEIISTHLTQLLVAAMEIKGCALFVLNPESQELEILASFGLSISYLNKGPVLTGKSIVDSIKGIPIVVRDINQSDKLQYPENAKAEGIRAIVAMPIKFKGSVVGALRLYHHEPWDLSERDLELLQCLSDTIGLAMNCTRLLNALQIVKEAVTDIHQLWI
jgi:transcriptional regulator with GAF, ATPase, and Fis domain